jgi:hypothetical protein
MAQVAPAARAAVAPARPAVLAQRVAVFAVRLVLAVVLARQVAVFAAPLAQAVVLAQRVAVFAVLPALAVVLAQRVAVFAVRLAPVAVLARQGAVFAACAWQVARSAAGSAQPAAAWRAQSAALFARRVELAQAGSGGRNRLADERPALRAAPAVRLAEPLAASAARAVIAARAQAAANAVAEPAAVVAEALLSLAAAEEAVLLWPAEEVAGLLVVLAAERLAVVAPAAAQREARERRPVVSWARRPAVRQGPAPVQALARGGGSTDRSRACRRKSRRRPEWYWSSAADVAISLSMSLGNILGKVRAAPRKAGFLFLAHDASQRTSKS